MSSERCNKSNVRVSSGKEDKMRNPKRVIVWFLGLVVMITLIQSIGRADNSLAAADGDPQEALFVDAIGNVGIGMKNPLHKLSVDGSISIGKEGEAPGIWGDGFIYKDGWGNVVGILGSQGAYKLGLSWNGYRRAGTSPPQWEVVGIHESDTIAYIALGDDGISFEVWFFVSIFSTCSLASISESDSGTFSCCFKRRFSGRSE